MNKKAQFGEILIFAGIIIAMLILAPFVLKIWNSAMTPFATALGTVSPVAQANVTHIGNVFINFWDWVIIIAFLIKIFAPTNV